MTERRVGLLGATGLVGECLIPRLVANGFRVCALSRTAAAPDTESVQWRQPGAATFAEVGQIEYWLCVAPIWVLPDYFHLLGSAGARRVVALSSTSRFTKNDSSDSAETDIAARLADGEQRLQTWAAASGAQSVILRPTLSYGHGRDKNIAEIARFIRRFGFFPLFGRAAGLRQPIHVDDVAAVCLAALQAPRAAQRIYNVSGAEVLPYRAMVARVFAALGRPQRLLTVPLWAFRVAVGLLRLLPRYRGWSAAMAERMNRDQAFDHADAARDLAFKPRRFALLPRDVAARDR